MEKKYMETELFCIHCEDDTLHQITYINDVITKVECEECHNIIELRVNVMQEFYKESYQRIASKPARMTNEYRDDLSHFLFSLPIRVITKPYRIVKDLKGSREIIRDYQSTHHKDYG
ncbi:bh protein [Radiobacillus kanasensis]|uniref:bh protein n=1 Tax=Radiobacillus kanasensis TaxID=2844358 RepID=UPI001E566B17|nr:bh protein [Radiobacillus kanasensis]UFT98596.1 bh protein [Radiobacillus kanasensis]